MPAAVSKRHFLPSLTIGIGDGQWSSPSRTVYFPSSTFWSVADFSKLESLSQNNPPFQAQALAWSNAVNTLISDVQNGYNYSQAEASYNNNEENMANSCTVRDYPFTPDYLGII